MRALVFLLCVVVAATANVREPLPSVHDLMKDLQGRVGHLYPERKVRDLEQFQITKDDVSAILSGGSLGFTGAVLSNQNFKPSVGAIAMNAGVGALAGFAAHRFGASIGKKAQIFETIQNKLSQSLGVVTRSVISEMIQVSTKSALKVYCDSSSKVVSYSADVLHVKPNAIAVFAGPIQDDADLLKEVLDLHKRYPSQVMWLIEPSAAAKPSLQYYSQGFGAILIQNTLYMPRVPRPSQIHFMGGKHYSALPTIITWTKDLNEWVRALGQDLSKLGAMLRPDWMPQRNIREVMKREMEDTFAWLITQGVQRVVVASIPEGPPQIFRTPSIAIYMPREGAVTVLPTTTVLSTSSSSVTIPTDQSRNTPEILAMGRVVNLLADACKVAESKPTHVPRSKSTGNLLTGQDQVAQASIPASITPENSLLVLGLVRDGDAATLTGVTARQRHFSCVLTPAGLASVISQASK